MDSFSSRSLEPSLRSWSVTRFPLQLVLWFGLMPTTGLALSGITAFLALSLHYEWVHYLAHVHFVPAIRYYQQGVKQHRRHHFKNEHYWNGVSMTLGDRVLGTEPLPDTVETSPTARSLLDLSEQGEPLPSPTR